MKMRATQVFVSIIWGIAGLGLGFFGAVVTVIEINELVPLPTWFNVTTFLVLSLTVAVIFGYFGATEKERLLRSEKQHIARRKKYTTHQPIIQNKYMAVGTISISIIGYAYLVFLFLRALYNPFAQDGLMLTLGPAILIIEFATTWIRYSVELLYFGNRAERLKAAIQVAFITLGTISLVGIDFEYKAIAIVFAISVSAKLIQYLLSETTKLSSSSLHAMLLIIPLYIIADVVVEPLGIISHLQATINDVATGATLNLTNEKVHALASNYLWGSIYYSLLITISLREHFRRNRQAPSLLS